MKKAIVYILIIIGLLSICIGTNYDYISNIINKDKTESGENTEEPEEEPETKETTNLINEEDYQTEIKKYYESIDKMSATSYFIEDINETEVTAKEVPGLGEEYTNINDQPLKKQKLSSNVKIYLYDVRTTTNESAKASGDETIMYKKLTVEEAKTIIKEYNISAYYEIDKEEVVQILLVWQDKEIDTIK